jgi:hypothetical protein
MSIHYLIDAHTNPVADSDINEVRREPPSGESPLMGNFIVRIPEGMPLEGEPTDLSDLLVKKYAAVLDFYPGFANIAYDDMLDSSGITPSPGNILGSRSSISANPVKTLTSVPVALGGTPVEAIITWEAFSIIPVSPIDNLMQVIYKEEDANGFACTVSFNNGASYSVITDGGLFNIPPADQGSNFIIKLLNSAGQRLRLGSWAVIY